MDSNVPEALLVFKKASKERSSAEKKLEMLLNLSHVKS